MDKRAEWINKQTLQIVQDALVKCKISQKMEQDPEQYNAIWEDCVQFFQTGGCCKETQENGKHAVCGLLIFIAKRLWRKNLTFADCLAKCTSHIPELDE